MAQKISITTLPSSVKATNVDARVIASETIILDGIPTLGFNNFGLTATNNSAVNVAAVAIYGSDDGVHYYSITGGTAPLANSTTHSTFNAVSTYMRVTATSAGSSAVNVYLMGTT